MQQARLALGAAVLGYCGHWAYVARERAAVRDVSGRLLQFSPGSQDEIMSSQLRTGDLLLFSRDATLYTGLAAVTSASRKALTGCAYDHAGIVVVRGHTPYVLERSPSGAHHLRRYDARIRLSMAREIVLRPLHSRQPLDDAALDAFIKEGQDVPMPHLLLMECINYAVQPHANASLDFVRDAYLAMGLKSATEHAPLRMVDIEPAQRQAPASFSNASFGKAAWVRDLR